jgi:DNA-binding response OmpR family regulator
MSNAIKFTPEGGIIQVTAVTEDHRFVLAVQDNGIGMAPEELSNIFDRYYQVKDPLTTPEHFGGIGLALIQEEVAQLAGSINVESKKGKGTTFTVKLPLYPAEDEQEKTTGKTAEPPFVYPVGEEHIVLIVEDHPDVRFYLNRLLSDQYRIVTASDGEEGFKKATALIPDIIISDVIMPNMDGYRLTSKLKEDLRTSHIPIILLTAKSKHQDRLQGLSGGADAYLIKPFEEDELQLRIKKLIENREQLKKAYAEGGISDKKRMVVDPFLKKTTRVLEEHFKEDTFGAKELAEAIHLSRMQLHRKLKALTNLSACQFINKFRLEKGKMLLSRNELNVSEVAYDCGFSDPGYFSKLFSGMYGQSPLHFKRSPET